MASDENTPLLEKKDWEHGLFVPTMDCALTCCGCYPIYKTIHNAGPFTAVFIPVVPEMALVWALLFWIGTLYVDKAVLVFTILFVCYAVGLKNHLKIDEGDATTACKALCCVPCIVGQLSTTTDAQKDKLVGEPVQVAPPAPTNA